MNMNDQLADLHAALKEATENVRAQRGDYLEELAGVLGQLELVMSEVGGTSNLVRLTGRLSEAAVERRVPAGPALVAFRLTVDREGEAAERQKVDALDCMAWTDRTRKEALQWGAGDVIAIEGAVRRRFFVADGISQSRVEIEVTDARLVAPAGAGARGALTPPTGRQGVELDEAPRVPRHQSPGTSGNRR